MKTCFRLLVLCIALPSASALNAQNTTPSPAQATAPAKHQPPKPAADQAPGAGPDKVWVNTTTKVYQCPGDRYYGRTKAGKYMTEPEAKAAGAHGARNKVCFK